MLFGAFLIWKRYKMTDLIIWQKCYCQLNIRREIWIQTTFLSRDGDFAEELFISLENPGLEAYSAIIQGMAKYYQVDRAYELFEEAQMKQIPLNTNTYNSIISVSNFIKESFDLRWSFVTNLLQQMQMNKLKPNLGTLNATLQTLSTMGNNNFVKETTLKVLAEFKACGIEPSLASWYFVLITFCKESKY